MIVKRVYDVIVNPNTDDAFHTTVEANWDPLIPVQIVLLFSEPEKPVEWVFGRDLLDAAYKLHAIAGYGDVQILLDRTKNDLTFYLRGGDGTLAEVTGDARAWQEFVEATKRVIPLGDESPGIQAQVDHFLNSLFA